MAASRWVSDYASVYDDITSRELVYKILDENPELLEEIVMELRSRKLEKLTKRINK